MPRGHAHTGSDQYLDGQLLVAMPGMADDNFARTVVYLCAHSEDGAMGIVINKRAVDLQFSELLVQLDIIEPEEAIRLPAHIGDVDVLRGGPVEAGRGFVLHTPDFTVNNSTLSMNNGVCLTATVDILRAMAAGDGPESALFALGYAGWAPGQLETEIQANGWLHCPATTTLLFETAVEHKYEMALRSLGADIATLSGQAGHA